MAGRAINIPAAWTPELTTLNGSGSPISGKEQIAFPKTTIIGHPWQEFVNNVVSADQPIPCLPTRRGWWCRQRYSITLNGPFPNRFVSTEFLKSCLVGSGLVAVI
jgi:hypothetical protein